MGGAVEERRKARAAAAAAAAGGGLEGGGGSTNSDLLDLLLDAQDAGVLNGEQVEATLLTFIIAGHDTTAHTLSWMLFEVATHRGGGIGGGIGGGGSVTKTTPLQDALAAEALAALPDREAFPQRGDLRALPLLDRTFKEAMRKHPVAATGTLRIIDGRCREFCLGAAAAAAAAQ